MIKKNLYILFLLASAFSFAQVNLYSKINSRETKLNAPLVFTVVLEIVGEDLVQETPMQLPDFSKFNFDYVSEQNTIIDPIKKIRVNQMVCQISLDPKQTGNIKIGSALVKVNGKPVVTVDSAQFIRYIDRHVYEMNRDKVPAMLAILEEIKTQIASLAPNQE